MHRLLKTIVVEDNEILCRLFAENLRHDPQIQTDEAGSLEAALELAKGERHLVMLVDLGLPDAHGIEAIPALRQVVPGATLVVVTGDATLRESAMMAGAHAVIIKGSPESHGDELVAAVRAAVMNHDLELLNAPTSNRINRVGDKLDAVKKLLPAALVWLGMGIGYPYGRADAAEQMRDENEARVMVGERDAGQSGKPSVGL